MRRLAIVCVLAAALPATASAAPVRGMSPDGQIRDRDGSSAAADRPLRPPPPGTMVAPGSSAARHAGGRPRASAAGGGRRGTVKGELARMLRRDKIDRRTLHGFRRSYSRARRAARGLSGTQADELGAVVATVRAIAAKRMLGASRLPALKATLDRNRKWWTATDSPPLSYGKRVEFDGSELVWQYYPGQGIQLQMLGNMGKANGLWQAATTDDSKRERRRFKRELGRMLDELTPLAAWRHGARAWEYYFTFGGGSPPWTSGISQGTALQVLARSAKLFPDRRKDLRRLGRQALRLFEHAPPAGVRQRTKRGAHYLIYSYAPTYHVLNAFIQALNGLWDFGHLAHSKKALALFDAGDREARWEVPYYNTGDWSKYSPTETSTVDYHRLLRDFLQGLCDRTGTDVYCHTAKDFTKDLQRRGLD